MHWIAGFPAWALRLQENDRQPLRPKDQAAESSQF